ncbi:hypothetical protein SUGI_0501200 [Cryptomeria japonica]|nr:hypothetical protein SUGI_0501200 [Cryptomeria japonica]
MEKHAGKRKHIEERDENGRFCEEPEARSPKRLCKESNINVVSEIMSKIYNDDLGLGVEEIEEEMVWDMMKMLEEEIGPSPSCSDDTGTSSNGYDELESSGDKDCSFNAEFDYLLSASDDELGIPCSPSVNTGNDCDYDSRDFFKCLEMEDVEEQLFWQFWLGYGESVEQDGNDILSVHDRFQPN